MAEDTHGSSNGTSESAPEDAFALVGNEVRAEIVVDAACRTVERTTL